MTHFDDQSYDDPYSQERESNPLGVVGFVLSILCITSPLGLIISLIALFKNPKGFAIAGVIIGIIFSAIIGLFAWFFVVFGTVFFNIASLAVDLSRINIEIEAYIDANQAPPASLDDIGWTEQDPWGNDYLYSLDEETGVWTITVVGPDGQVGTDDDMVFDSEMSDTDRQEVMSEWAEENAEEMMRKGSNP